MVKIAWKNVNSHAVTCVSIPVSYNETANINVNKKAVLSQRWPSNAPYIWVPWKFFGTPWLHPRPLFPTFSWAFVPIDPMNVPTKFKVRSFTRYWDNRGCPKNGQSLDTPTLNFLPKFEWAFTWIGPVNMPAKFEVRSFTRSWDNRGYSKNLDSPWIRPRSVFWKIFNGLLFG